METKTQEQFVKSILRENGEISRNDCLTRHITRLGAIICHLNQNGWQIKGEWTTGQKDYVYKTLKKPQKPKYYFDETRNCMVLMNPNKLRASGEFEKTTENNNYVVYTKKF